MNEIENLKEKKDLLTVNEVAKLLRIGRAKVYLLIEAEAITGIKIGNTWRIKNKSILRLLEDQE